MPEEDGEGEGAAQPSAVQGGAAPVGRAGPSGWGGIAGATAAISTEYLCHPPTGNLSPREVVTLSQSDTVACYVGI